MVNHNPETIRSFVDKLSLTGPVEPFLVFADWLQDQGDPWGEIIAIDCALERKGIFQTDEARPLVLARSELVAKRGHEMCPLLGWDVARPRCKRGFIFKVVFEDCSNADTRRLEQCLNGLFCSPMARFLEEISFAKSKLGDARADIFTGDAQERFGKLASLDLTGNLFSEATVGRLQQALPRARLDAQGVAAAPPPPTYPAPRDEHRDFLRVHGGARSIEDYD
jgi:hypothetical protein